MTPLSRPSNNSCDRYVTNLKEKNLLWEPTGLKPIDATIQAISGVCFTLIGAAIAIGMFCLFVESQNDSTVTDHTGDGAVAFMGVPAVGLCYYGVELIQNVYDVVINKNAL